MAGIEDKGHRPPAETRSRVPIRRLAAATVLAAIAAQFLSHLGGTGSASAAPAAVVAGQTIWNAAQVGLLLLLLCLWVARRGWWVAILATATLACLPFAIYATAPGAWAVGNVMLAACATALGRNAPDIGVAIVDAPVRGAAALAKVELLGFVCNLLCSMYNYNASRLCWPYWASLYERAAAGIGFTPSPDTIARAMFTLNLPGVLMPPYVTAGRSGGNLGAVVFLLIWTVLPFLYVLYFAALAKLANNSYGTRVQQALCLFCIVHFLFLTDIVDYQFGRGVLNPFGEWAHWSERLAWRIAILLPVYQKLAAGDLRRGNGRVGVALHYALAAWAAVFFVYQVVLYDVPRFQEFAAGKVLPYHKVFGIGYRQELGYHGALVLMTAVYGFMVIAMRCKQISAVAVPTRTSRVPLPKSPGPFTSRSAWTCRRS